MSNFKPFHWICPFCRRDTTVVEANIEHGAQGFHNHSAAGQAFLQFRRIVCPSPDCRQFEFEATLSTAAYGYNADVSGWEWKNLRAFGRGHVRFSPKSSAVAFPLYVPEGIRADYEEACDIVELSPKAAATLARRALQGLIRDFWGAKGRTLKDEIDSVKALCDPMIWDAMEAVRRVGNIGAHMERDVDVIIDVESGEAQMLIELLETLVRETYEAREARSARMNALKAMADTKTAAKKPTS